MHSCSISFDNKNSVLGDYFLNSKENLKSFLILNSPLTSYSEINTDRCNLAFIDFYIPTINTKNFIFVAYSHGTEDSLLANNDYYIKKDVNTHLFCNCFFYSMSCLTGDTLGLELINSGSHSFIGYKEIAYVPLLFKEDSIDCDNYGIVKFFEGHSIEDSFKLMKENFNKKIDSFLVKGEPIIASLLRKNRDALVLFGNGNLTITDFKL